MRMHIFYVYLIFSSYAQLKKEVQNIDKICKKSAILQNDNAYQGHTAGSNGKLLHHNIVSTIWLRLN